MKNFGSRGTGDRQHDWAADDVLRGLPPELVIMLARLAGEGLDDLSTTIEFMPYPYRALMSAYDMIEMGEPRAGQRRLVRATPFCSEVTAAAANLVASMVKPADVGRRIATEAADRKTDRTPVPPFVPVLPASEQEPVAAAEMLSFEAVLRRAEQGTGGNEWILVFTTPTAHDGAGEHAAEQGIRIRSDVDLFRAATKQVTVHTPVSSLVYAATITETADEATTA